MLEDTVQATGAIVERRDPYTGDHQRRTTALALAIAREMGLDEHRCEGIRLQPCLSTVSAGRTGFTSSSVVITPHVCAGWVR